jgi:hypothetical protein
MSKTTEVLTHWVGPYNNTIHGNGAAVMQPVSTDPTKVTCNLCHSLLARPDDHA